MSEKKSETGMARVKIVMNRPALTPVEQQGFLKVLVGVLGISVDEIKDSQFTTVEPEAEPKAVFNMFMDHTSGSSFEPGGLRAEFETVCRVIAVIPEFHQTKVQNDEGHMFAITENTPGVDYADLKEGQKVKCAVSPAPHRVLFAELIP